MAMIRMRMGRMKKELEMLKNDPPPGICAYLIDNNCLDNLEAKVEGPKDSPFEKGIFKLSVLIPERYPIHPPQLRFITRVYHPNIDEAGRICLDLLKMQPQGSWKPSINLSTLLVSIRLLLAKPNPDDGLMPMISTQFVNDRQLYNKVASSYTKKYATEGTTPKSKKSIKVITEKKRREPVEEKNLIVSDLSEEEEEVTGKKRKRELEIVKKKKRDKKKKKKEREREKEKDEKKKKKKKKEKRKKKKKKDSIEKGYKKKKRKKKLYKIP